MARPAESISDTRCDVIRASLRKVLASAELSTAGRLRAFLEFVVLEELAGRGAEIKEYTVAVAVFEKPADFDPRDDAAVRVSATKLRNRLQAYYQTAGVGDPVVISIPKGGYRPEFTFPSPPSESAKPSAEPALPGRKKFIAAAVGFLLASASLVVAYSFRNGTRSSAPIRTQITNGPEQKSGAAFSPLGTHVAFSSDLHERGNLDIYVKNLGNESLLRLTSDPAADSHPAWSPDGTSIAFIRNAGYSGAIYLTSTKGGAERKVANVNLASLGWTSDSRYLAASHQESQVDPPHLLLIDVQTGLSRPLVEVRPGFADYEAAFSPDGKHVAVGRCDASNSCDVYVGDYVPGKTVAGPLRRLTWHKEAMHGLAWTADSKEIVHSFGFGNRYQLARVSLQEPAEAGTLLVGPAEPAHYPTIPSRGALHRDILAYQGTHQDDNLWTIPYSTSGEQRLGAPQRLIASAYGDWQPDFTADGRTLAFVSDRTGRNQIWIANRDGTEQRQITAIENGLVLYPKWAPDSRSLVFSLYRQTKEGSVRALYSIQTNGSGLRQVTPDSHQALEASWSRDGKWIYFGSRASGQYQIWRADPTGKQPLAQITKSGGYRASESGGRLYYLVTGEGLWSVPSGGGEERKVLPEVKNQSWVTVRDGVLFLAPSGGDQKGLVLYHWRASGGQTRALGRFPHETLARFTVDPEETLIVYGNTDVSVSEIFTLENFR